MYYYDYDDVDDDDDDDYYYYYYYYYYNLEVLEWFPLERKKQDLKIHRCRVTIGMR